MALTRLDDDEKSTIKNFEGAPNGLPVNTVNESGLYNLILTSNKPQAKPFKKWVTSEVLPSIRNLLKIWEIEEQEIFPAPPTATWTTGDPPVDERKFPFIFPEPTATRPEHHQRQRHHLAAATPAQK